MNLESDNLFLQLTTPRRITDDELGERIRRNMLRVLRHDKPASGLRHDCFGFFKLDEFWKYTERQVGRLRDDIAGRLELDLETLIATEKVEIRSGKVRALYGHSLRGIIVGRLKWPEQTLLHATMWRYLEPIFELGLRCQSRSWVHLTTDQAYADSLMNSQIGNGPTVLLKIDPSLIDDEPVCFRQSNSHVWLATHIPPKAISVVFQQTPKA